LPYGALTPWRRKVLPRLEGEERRRREGGEKEERRRREGGTSRRDLRVLPRLGELLPRPAQEAEQSGECSVTPRFRHSSLSLDCEE
jgi:hypothetical protein